MEALGLVERARSTFFVVTTQGRALAMRRHSRIPVNPAHLELLSRMVGGFESIQVEDCTNLYGVAFKTSFKVPAAVAFLRSRTQCPASGALLLLQAFVNQGLVCRTDGLLEVTEDCVLAVTNLGRVLTRDTSDNIKRRNAAAADVRSLVPPPMPLWKMGAACTIDTVDAIEVARQLTLLFGSLSSRIQPMHMFKGAWSASNAESSDTPFNPAASLFSAIQRVSNWVAQQTLRSISRFGKFIAMANEMRALRNYSGVFAVVLGLSQHCVSRLNLSVPSASETTWATLTGLGS